MVTLIVGKCLDAAQSGLKKSGIATLNLRVIRASEPIAVMRIPQVVQDVENYVVDSVIIMIGNLVYDIGSIIGISGNTPNTNTDAIQQAALKKI